MVATALRHPMLPRGRLGSYHGRVTLPAPDTQVRTARGGAVFGFEVASSVPLRFMRAIGTTPPITTLTVREGAPRPDPGGPPLREWSPTDRNPFHARLWPDGDAYRLWIEGLGWFWIQPEAGVVEIPEGPDAVHCEERLWGIPSALVAVRHGVIPIHAAAVQLGDAAVVMAAPGRFGKTTLATAMGAAGHRVLTEDVCAIGLSPVPAVLPGPAVVRVRPDTFEALGIGAGQVALHEPTRVHLAIAPELRGTGDPVPVRAVVFLDVGDEIGFTRVDATTALPMLWNLTTKLPTDEDRTRCFEALADLASSVPVWHLRRPLRYDRLPDVIAAIEDEDLS